MEELKKNQDLYRPKILQLEHKGLEEKRKKMREYMRIYNKINKERIDYNNKKRRLKHNEQCRRYYHENKDKIRAYYKQYYEQNRDTLVAKQREKRLELKTITSE